MSTNGSEITYTIDSDDDIDLPTEEEIEDNWEEFLSKIELPQTENVWVFVEERLLHSKNDAQYIESLIGERLNIQYIDTTINTNVILASGRLSSNYKDKYTTPLISEVVSRNLFNIQENKNTNIFEINNLKPLIVICNETDKKHLFNNSSIWFRCIGLNNISENIQRNLEKTTGWENKSNEEKTRIKDAEISNEKIKAKVIELIQLFQKEFEHFQYNNTNAQENLDYQLRLHTENHLRQFGNGHTFIIPTTYHNELECADTILSINTEEVSEQQYPELVDFNDVTFRILLIDDKDGYNQYGGKHEPKDSKAIFIANLMEGVILEPFVIRKFNELEKKNIGLPKTLKKYSVLLGIEKLKSWIKEQDNQKEDIGETELSHPKNKLIEILDEFKKTISIDIILHKIKTLKVEATEKFEKKFIVDKVKNLISYLEKEYESLTMDYVADRLIWKEEDIEYFFYTTEKDKKKQYDTKYFDISSNKTSSNVQIIQVTNLADAITLLADESIRFDLILLDYLLDKRKDNPTIRQLSTDFFIWFQDKQGENRDVDYLRLQLYNGQKVKTLHKDEVDQAVLDFNKELRQRIKSNRGPLRKLWIFPITAFNETLIDDLTRNNVRLIDYYWHISKGADPITTPYLFLRMLNSFLYLQLESSVFMEDEIKEFLKKSIKRLKKVESSEDFIAVMGSDYTEFVQNFMNRSIIYRDKNNNSLFANYIWKHFYTNEKYKNEHILVNYIHRFYHRCAFGGNSEYRKMILFWRDMKLFIENNFSDWTKELNLETYYNILNQVYPK